MGTPDEKEDGDRDEAIDIVGEASAPLIQGKPLTLEESIERMYDRYGRTFEILSR